MSLTSRLGDPDIRVRRSHIWAQGRQVPEVQDYWDSNRLNVMAEYRGLGSCAKAHGYLIHLCGLVGHFERSETLNAELKRESVLDRAEPNLRVEVHAKSLGHLEIETVSTQVPLTGSHVYQELTDHAFLPPILESLRRVLARYPVREPGKTTQ